MTKEEFVDAAVIQLMAAFARQESPARVIQQKEEWARRAFVLAEALWEERSKRGEPAGA